MTTATPQRPIETAIRRRVTPSAPGPDSRAFAPEDWIQTYRFGLRTEWVMAAQTLTGCLFIAVFGLSGDGGALVPALAFLGFALTAPFRMANQPNMIVVSSSGSLAFRLPFEQLISPAQAIETLTRVTYTDSEGGVHHRMDISLGERELQVSVGDRPKAERFITSVARLNSQLITRGAWTSD